MNKILYDDFDHKLLIFIDNTFNFRYSDNSIQRLHVYRCSNKLQITFRWFFRDTYIFFFNSGKIGVIFTCYRFTLVFTLIHSDMELLLIKCVRTTALTIK